MCFQHLKGERYFAAYRIYSYSTWDETTRFAYVTRLREEGRQTHVVWKPKTLPTQDSRQRAQSTVARK
jgi:hypothetical protein